METRRSIGAYVFTLASGPIAWSSKQQPTISDSTTEAEYKALLEGAKEAVYIRRLLLELQAFEPGQVPVQFNDATIHKDLVNAHLPSIHNAHLHCDNQGSIKLARNPVFHAKTKHIESKHHFIRERVLEKEILLKYVLTNENPTNMFTKPLCRNRFELHRASIGIRSILELTT